MKNSKNKLALAATLASLLAATAVQAQESAEAPPPVSGQSVSGVSITEDGCEILGSDNGAKPELTAVPGMHVLGRDESNPLKLNAHDGVKLLAVMCWRSEARLSRTDYLVIDKIGVPLYIRTDTGDSAKDRAISLERSGGSYRVRLLSGPELSEAEKEEMISAMTLFNKKTSS